MKTSSCIICLLVILCSVFVPQIAVANGLLEYSLAQKRKVVLCDRTTIATRIHEQIAVTVLSQQFTITDSVVTDVRYGMPVPEAVTITGLRYRIGGAWRTAVIAASDTTIRPGTGGGTTSSHTFLSTIGATGFVFPFRDTLRSPVVVEIEVTMVELLPMGGGRVTYQFPLSTLLQFGTDSVSWSLSLRTSNEMKNVEVLPSPSVFRSNTATEVIVDERRISTATDPKVSYAVTIDSLVVTMLSAKPTGQDGYALLLATPASAYDYSILPKRFTFVIDRSGSMVGHKIEDAKSGALYCLQRVSPFDEINVIEFNSHITSLWDRPQPATQSNVAMCLDFVSRLTPRDGTEIMGALTRAFQTYEDTAFVNVVIFLTDGQATIDHARLLQENRRGVRVFVFGVGSNVNYIDLRRIAVDHRGEVVFVNDGGSATDAISTLYERIKDPLFKNPALSFSPDVMYDFAPLSIPDIYAGDQLVVASRYSRPGPVDAVLAGTNISGRHELPFRVVLVDEDTTAPFVPKIWARLRINTLRDLMSKTTENSSLWREYRDEIIRLGKTFGIVTPFTTFEQGNDDPNPTSVEATDGPIVSVQMLASPNPVRTFTRLTTEFDSEHPHVRISLTDIRGVNLAIIPAGSCTAGVWSFDLHLDALGVTLAPGVYVITVHAGSEVRTMTITIEG